MRVEVLSGVERRRRWSDCEKSRIPDETLAPGARVSEIARRHGVSASLVLTWRRLARQGHVSSNGPTLIRVEIVALPAPGAGAVPMAGAEPARGRRTLGLIEIDLGQGRRLRRPTVTAGIRSAECPIQSTDGDAPQRTLGGVVRIRCDRPTS